MIHEWHVVFLAGLTTGLLLHWLLDKLARVVKGPWLVLGLLLMQGCAPALWLGVGLRVAGAAASIGYAANQGKKEVEAAAARGYREEPDDGSEAWRQRRARSRATYEAEGCLR